jgi:hypothetical protein
LDDGFTRTKMNRIANEPESMAALAALKTNFLARRGGHLGSYAELLSMGRRSAVPE